jgi:branched-chain amino acid transport system ATP-binding protein
VLAILEAGRGNTVMSLADRGYVLETGMIALTGRARTLLEDTSVRKAYLGL